MLQLFAPFAVFAEVAPSTSTESWSQEYTDLTKKILLSGIELERYSLKFRLDNGKQPKFRKLRYFLAQESGASCGLAFEIVGVEQFGKGRRRPLEVSKPALHGALATVTTGSIIAGSGSCLEFGSNFLQTMKNRWHGNDHRAARKFVVAKLKQIDQLLAQRQALVAANTESESYERAVIEGKILRDMRNCFINEFSHFYADTKGYTAFQNTFFLLNAAYNAVGAAGGGVAYKAVDVPKYNGPANILFTVSGAMASVSPLISTAVSKVVRKQAEHSLARELHEKPNFDSTAFAAHCKQLQELAPESEGRLIPSLPATQRLAMYTQSDQLFAKQLESETTTMRKLNKIALQTSILGPAIGGQLMTQGILGTIGYYKYTLEPRKQINRYYQGAVVGTVGTSMAVVGNAAWLLSSISYEHRLAKEKRLPAQLINARLDHLDDLEKIVSAL
jgi:hypothetical protein